MTPKLEKALAVILRRVEAGESLDTHKVGKEAGVSHLTAEKAIAVHNVLKMPEMAPSKKKEFETALRLYKKKLDAEFDHSVLQEVKKRLDEIVLPTLNKREAMAAQILKNRKGVWTQAEFNSILKCLHPDTGNLVSTDQKTNAFRLMNDSKHLLISEKELPTTFNNMPKTYAEMMARRK